MRREIKDRWMVDADISVLAKRVRSPRMARSFCKKAGHVIVQGEKKFLRLLASSNVCMSWHRATIDVLRLVAGNRRLPVRRVLACLAEIEKCRN